MVIFLYCVLRFARFARFASLASLADVDTAIVLRTRFARAFLVSIFTNNPRAIALRFTYHFFFQSIKKDVFTIKVYS